MSQRDWNSSGTGQRATRSRQQRRRRMRCELLEPRHLLATITVTSLDDNLTPGGGVTLREALQAANTDTSVDGSVAGSGADVIEFQSGLSGVFRLAASCRSPMPLRSSVRVPINSASTPAAAPATAC